jgi:hypothetical protein
MNTKTLSTLHTAPSTVSHPTTVLIPTIDLSIPQRGAEPHRELPPQQMLGSWESTAERENRPALLVAFRTSARPTHKGDGVEADPKKGK